MPLRTEAQTIEIQVPPFCPNRVGGLCLRPQTCTKCISDWQSTHTTVVSDPRPDCIRYSREKPPKLPSKEGG